MSRNSPQRSVDLCLQVSSPVFNLLLILLQVFSSLNLNCKTDFIVSLEIENNKLDLVGKIRSFQSRMSTGRFAATTCGISSCPYPPDVSNSRTCCDVNRRNANSSVVDRLYQLWVLFFLGLPFRTHANRADVAGLMLSISVRLRRDAWQLQILN